MSVLSSVETRPLVKSTRKATVLAAKRGDEAAYEALLADFVPNLRALSRAFADRIGRDEAEAAALLGFVEAVAAYDPEEDPDGVGVVAILSGYVRESLAASAGVTMPFTVPDRTAKRFWGILRQAEGDPLKAAALAPSRDMAEDTFRSLYALMRGTSSLESWADTEAAGGDSFYGWSVEAASVEDRFDVARAFDAVDDLESSIVKAAYGFTDYRPMSDAEIAEEGWAGSRSKVQRVRAGALAKMRVALGADA
jgi:DNA-directed RNA polymerase specialized sigma subunit